MPRPRAFALVLRMAGESPLTIWKKPRAVVGTLRLLSSVICDRDRTGAELPTFLRRPGPG